MKQHQKEHFRLNILLNDNAEEIHIGAFDSSTEGVTLFSVTLVLHSGKSTGKKFMASDIMNTAEHCEIRKGR